MVIKVTIETGAIARQADGAVMVNMADTGVLVTAVGSKTADPGRDFFPLTVNYQEKTYAAGKIPGGFFKREGRPSEKETLVCRLIDRPIRPLFPKGFTNEVQVIATVVSLNPDVDPDIPVCRNIGVDIRVQRHDGRDDLNLIREAFREQRPKRTIDEAAYERLFLARAPLALEEPTGNLAGSVSLFLVVHGQREEIPAGIGNLAANGRHQHPGVGHVDHNCAIGLTRNSTGFDSDLMFTILERFLS